MIGAERVDFVAVPTGDRERAVNAREKLGTAGVEFKTETMDSEVCHMAVFSDPDGNAFLLHRRYAPYSSGSTP